MSKNVLVFLAATAVSVTMLAGGAGYAYTTIHAVPPAAPPPPAPPAPPSVAHTPSPAKTAITGLSKAALVDTGMVANLEADPAWPTMCTPVPRTWAEVDSAAGVGAGAAATVTIGAWGAGRAPEIWSTLLAAGQDCPDVSVEQTSNNTMAVTDAAGKTWQITRRGDVITAVGASAFGSGAWTVAANLSQHVDTALVVSLRGVCATFDADATTVDWGARTPYGPNFTGRTVESVVTLTAPAELPWWAPMVPALPSTSTWTEPSPTPVPSLAPYREPAAGDTLTGNLPTSPGTRDTPPNLVDPDTVAGPPQADEPTDITIPAPAAHTQTVALVDPDTTGPGCGWAFTGQAPAASDSKAIAAANRKARLNGYIALNRGDANSLNAALAYPARRRALIAPWQQWLNFDAYTRFLDSAEQAWSDARTTYEDSTYPWLVTPSPTASPTPTDTPSPTASPTPTGTPTPTPTVTPTPTPSQS